MLIVIFKLLPCILIHHSSTILEEILPLFEMAIMAFVLFSELISSHKFVQLHTG